MMNQDLNLGNNCQQLEPLKYRVLFVTVGTTRFDELIKKILDRVDDLEFKELILQVGNSHVDRKQVADIRAKGIDIEIYDFKNSIAGDIEQADVVVGHAGAGTCLEVLRANKRLIVVVNDNLMDNHQAELADQLASDKYLDKSDLKNLVHKLQRMCMRNHMVRKFPARDPRKFGEVFNEALKKVSRL